MKINLLKSSLIAGLLALQPAHAQVGLSGSISSNGLGLHVVTPITDKFNARLGFNAGQIKVDGVANYVRYDGTIKGRTVDALIDYFPADSAFRITAGVIYNDNRVDLVGRPDINGSFVFNGVTYTAAQIVGANGQIEFQKIVPYLGLGWGNGMKTLKGWSFAADLGILFQGSPETTLSLVNCLAGPLCPQIQNNLNAETAAVNREAENYRYFPIVRIGMTYRF